MPIFKKSLSQESFIVEDVFSLNVQKLAYSIINTIISNSLDSQDGICISFDRPLGSKTYLCNFDRPAVLRQHYSSLVNNNLFCYGTGSGSTSVGTHPDFEITREMPSSMKVLSKIIHKYILLIQSDTSLVPVHMDTEPFNHCTVLFYYHKNSRSTNKMLGFHTDNVYSKNGRFLEKANSQRRNTPTCVLTLGDSRVLHFQKQFRKYNVVTKKRKWVSVFTKHVKLTDNSISVLHPSDEFYSINESMHFRWRHGVLNQSQRNSLSIAFVFRNVKNTKPLSQLVDNKNHPLMTEETVQSAEKSLDRLRFLFQKFQKRI